jgi:hypothetical protein
VASVALDIRGSGGIDLNSINHTTTGMAKEMYRSKILRGESCEVPVFFKDGQGRMLGFLALAGLLLCCWGIPSTRRYFSTFLLVFALVVGAGRFARSHDNQVAQKKTPCQTVCGVEQKGRKRGGPSQKEEVGASILFICDEPLATSCVYRSPINGIF